MHGWMSGWSVWVRARACARTVLSVAASASVLTHSQSGHWFFFRFSPAKKNFFFKFILMLFFPLTLNSPKRAPAHAHSDTDIHAPNALYLQAIEWISPVQSATAADLSSNVCVCMCVCAGAGGNNFRGRWKKGNPCLKSDSCWKKKKEKKKVILIKEK